MVMLTLVIMMTMVPVANADPQRDMQFCKTLASYLYVSYESGYDMEAPSTTKSVYREAGLESTMKKDVIYLADIQWNIGYKHRTTGSGEGIPENVYIQAATIDCMKTKQFDNYRK